MKKFRNRKSIDSINNVLDAFLALKDIDDEEVIGMVRNVKKIDEGVDISLVTSTNAELDDAREFIKNDKHKDEDVEIEVIDANADAIDHVKNNKDYIGQVILCCNRCHSNKFIDMTDLVPSEEDPNLYNVEEECPFCKESGFGYRVIGQVGKVQTPVENNIEPSVEGEDEDEVSFNTENENGDADEASFDNDVAAEDENSDENSEGEATESEDTDEEVAEEDTDEDEEEKPFDETSAHEDEDEDDDKSKLGEEFVPEYKLDEEEVSNAFKSVGGLKEDSTNKYAEEAWLMNQVISSMNNEEAYYGSWLYIWPDGETRKDCEYDFGNKEAFEELKEEFIDTYKAYHSDGLYDATEEVLAYAHKWDKLLDLAPIENFVVEELEEDDDEDDAEQPADVDNKSDETDEGVKVSNLLSIFIEPENLKNIEIDGDVYDEFDEIPQATLNKKVKGFNSKDSSLTIYVINEEDVPEVSDEIIHVVDLLNLFDNEDEKFKKLIIEDAESSEEIFRGNKVGAIAACADCVVTHLEKPEALVISLVEDDDEGEDEPDAVADVDNDEEVIEKDLDETLFEEICRENNLHSYKVNRVGSEEYWLNEDLINEDDLQTVYEKYCRGKNCAQRFKEQFSQYEFIDSTEYRLDEALKKLNESGFTADEFDKLNKLAKELGLGDSLKNIQDFAKEHGCNNMGEIIKAMEIELVEKQYKEHPEQFYADDKNTGQHLLKQDPVKGAFVSVDGGETWEECSEEEFDELLAGGYKVVEEYNDENIPNEETIEVEENCKSFKTRKELKEAIKECENNNRPYNVRRSTKEGYRFDLLTEVEEEKPTIGDLIADENEAIDGYDAAIRNLANSDVNIDDRFAAIARLQEIKGDEIEHIAELQELGDRLCNAEVECPQCGCAEGECRCHENNKSDDAKSDDIKSIEDAAAVLKEEKSKNSWLASLPTEDPEQSIFEDLEEDDDDVEVVVEPDEIINAPDANDDAVSDVVPNNLSEEEITVLGKVSRIANDICEAIKNYYDIEVAPALVVADILQDLKLISGAIDISELEDTPINNLTKQMFQNYEDSYRLVDDIMTTLTGEPFTTLPETKLRDAINSLDGPQFDKENIERMIRSPKFVAAVEQGMVPYIPNGMNHELIESMKQKVNEDAAVDDEIEDKLDIYSDDKVLYDVVAPHVIDLIGNPTTLHYDDLHIYTDKVVSAATEVEPAEYEEKDVPWDYEVEWDVEDDLLPFIETHYDINKFNKGDLDKFDADAFVKYLSDKYREDAQDDAQTNWEEAEPDYNDDVDEAIDEVEVDVDQFDNFINEYFNENYGDDTTLLYHTIDGTVSDKGKIVLEGIIKGAEKGRGCEKNVVFTLTPKNNINEKLESNNNDVDVDTMSALGLIDYKVENDLSEETWDFKFINGTPNEEIFKLTDERKLKILKEFLKDAKGIDDHLVPAEVVKEAAIWEYERNKMQYIKMGLDVCHIENALSEVVDQIDFTPLIENEEPQPQQ